MHKAGHGHSDRESYSATRDNPKAKNLCAAALTPSAGQARAGRKGGDPDEGLKEKRERQLRLPV